MKLFNLLICLLLSGFMTVSAQDEPTRANPEQAKKIQAMEVAYITKELNLTPEEAQKFWPIFNQYRDQVRAVATNRNTTDQLEKQQQVLDLRKKYRSEFSRVLAADRANRVFSAEDQFRQMVRREFQKRQQERRQINPAKRGF
jgi:Spy/CpxP family protein refolding chaperone